MRPGDLYWYNDCYASSGAVSHSPDQVLRRAGVRRRRAGRPSSQAWAHFTDIGGMRAGLAVARLHRDLPGRHHRPAGAADARGRDQRGAAADLLSATRASPTMVRGDTRACMAAVRLGERRLEELFARFGADAHGATPSTRLIDAHRAGGARQAARAGPEGTYRFTDTIDTDGHGNGPITCATAGRHRGRPHRPRRQRERRPGAGAGQLPDEPAGAGHGVRLSICWAAAPRASLQRRRRARDRRGDPAPGLDPAAALSRAARACAASP